MGVDVNLYAEIEVSPERLIVANETFKNRCSIADEYTKDDGTVVWRAIAVADSEWFPRLRVVANVTCRYWGPGYERGDWPSTYGAIRWMQTLFPEAKVYYGGDSSDDGEECTEEMLAAFWEHYLGPNGNAYRERTATWTAAQVAPSRVPGEEA